jgi:hypothetical protein
MADGVQVLTGRSFYRIGFFFGAFRGWKGRAAFLRAVVGPLAHYPSHGMFDFFGFN